MPGRSLIDAAGAVCHIMVRGIERIEVFESDTDSNHFAERPLDSGQVLWPWALARDRVSSEGKSSRRRSCRIRIQKGALFCQVKDLTVPMIYSTSNE